MNFFEFFDSKEAKKEFGDIISRKKPVEDELSDEDTVERIIDEEPLREEHNYSMEDFFENLSDYDFKGCVILRASLMDISVERMSWGGLIKHIYEFIGDSKKIRKNSTMNLRDGKHSSENGFIYLPKLNLSFQAANSGKSIREVFIQVLRNDFKFRMEILRTPDRYVFHHN